MKVLLPVLSAVVFIIACHKDDPVQHTNFTSEELKWLALPTSRHFIYKDSASGKEDSVIVVESQVSESYAQATPASGLNPGSPAYYYEHYELAMREHDSVVNWFYGQAYAGSLVFYGNDNFTPMGQTYGYGFRYDLSNYLSDMEVDGKNYSDVVNTYLTSGGLRDTTQSWYFASNYYWAKGIGIIKRTVKTPSGIHTATLQRFGD